MVYIYHWRMSGMVGQLGAATMIDSTLNER